MREFSTPPHPISIGHDLLSDAKHLQPVCESEAALLPLESVSPALDPNLRSRVLEWLSEQVPEKRLQHIMRVEEMSVKLAAHHQLDTERAAKAGLMHDLAKCFKPQRLLALASDNGIVVDDVFENNPHLLHADVGAIVARDRFGIDDTEILDAIRNHTLGSAGMSPLSCVVFLADSLEPGRGDTPELQALQEASWKDLHRAVWLTSEYTLKYLFDSKSLIHPRALMTRNWAMQVTKGAASN